MILSTITYSSPFVISAKQQTPKVALVISSIKENHIAIGQSFSKRTNDSAISIMSHLLH